jgi:myo-inositol 2-dehydrogenase/D-chiro-inositol 1-dehydrogenase
MTPLDAIPKESDAMTRIAFLSTAHIHTKSFLQNIVNATDGRALCAIWDDVPDRGQRFAAEFNTAFMPDLDAVLTQSGADAFIICAENTRHLPLIEKAVTARKPIFCEKPLATTTAEAKRIVRLARANKTRMMSGYFQPFSGTMRAVAEMLRQNEFGKVTRVLFRNAHHAAYGRWFDSPDLKWFTDPALAGGGALMDMGTHAVHLLRTLFGPVTEVWASAANHAGVYPAVDDYAVAHLKFASGVFGTVEAAWTQTGGAGGLEVVGSEKTLWNNGAQYVVSAPKQQPTPIIPLADQPTRVDRLVGIVQKTVPDSEVQSDFAAAIDSVAIIESAYKSSLKGKWTKVPSIRGI